MTRLLMLLASLSAANAERPRCDAVIVFQSGSDAYDAALSGIRESLAKSSYTAAYVDLADPAWRTHYDAALRSARLVAVVGIGAWGRIGTVSLPLLPALVLRGDLKGARERHDAGVVFADVPLAAIALNLRTLFPGRSRLALIHRAGRPAPDAAAIARVKQTGFELAVVPCAGPEKLLATFTSIRGQADFVIAEPDPELYNSATVKPLVLASLEARLPIVGFSAAFVRAGALAGVFPDFHDLGVATGEAIERELEGKGKNREDEVRKVTIAVNQRIARLMGIEPDDRAHAVILK